jgi:hypothetical protein
MWRQLAVQAEQAEQGEKYQYGAAEGIYSAFEFLQIDAPGGPDQQCADG